MRGSKKTLTILIIVIIILVGSLAGASYAYFFTDMFRSDKQKFFIYMSKNIENIESLKSDELTNYIEKKKTQAYDNNGEFYTTVDEKTASEYMPNKKVYDEVEKFRILFQGQKDLASNYIYDTISLQYSNGEKMTFELATQDDYHGIKVDKILKKYLVLENNNLKEFVKNIGMDNMLDIPDKIEIKNFDKYKFTEEEIKNIKAKLYKILDENLQDTMFRNEKNDSYQKYTLTLTKGQAEDILYKMYIALINDEIIINKIKTIASEELKMTELEINNKIEEIKKEANNYLEKDTVKLEESDSTEKSTDTDLISINVYNDKAKKGNLPSLEIIDEESKISIGLSDDRISVKLDGGEKDGEATIYNPICSVIIDKTMENEDVSYIVEASIYKPINIEINGKMKFAGIVSGQDSVKEELTLGFELENGENTAKMQYTYLNNVKFNDSISKLDLKANGTIINNYDAQKLQTTFEKLTSLIDALNKKQMQSLGLEADQNPVLYMTPLFSYLRFPYSIYSDTQDAIGTSNLSEQEMMAFNNKFTVYEGSNITGARVNTLIQTVIASNSSNIRHEVAISIDGKEYKAGDNSVELTKKYTVKTNYKDGFVNQVNITTNID